MNRISLFLSQRILAIVFILLAIIGSAFLYSYVKDLRAKVPENIDFSEVILARHDIDVGQDITEDLIDKQPISQNIFSDKFVYDKDLIIGKKAKVDMVAGELISTDKIDDFLAEENVDISFSSYIPPNLRALSIPVSYYGDRYLLKNGDRIDLISVFTQQETNDLISETILEQKEIIMINSDDADNTTLSAGFLDNAIGDLSGDLYQHDRLILTLYLDSKEIEEVFLALKKGALNISICPYTARKGLRSP